MTTKLTEKFTDNGEHSHWELVDENGKLLWTEDADDRPISILSCSEKEFPNLFKILGHRDDIAAYMDAYVIHPEHIFSPYSVDDNVKYEDLELGELAETELKVVIKRCEDKDCSYFRFIL